MHKIYLCVVCAIIVHRSTCLTVWPIGCNFHPKWTHITLMFCIPPYIYNNMSQIPTYIQNKTYTLMGFRTCLWMTSKLITHHKMTYNYLLDCYCVLLTRILFPQYIYIVYCVWYVCVNLLLYNRISFITYTTYRYSTLL